MSVASFWRYPSIKPRSEWSDQATINFPESHEPHHTGKPEVLTDTVTLTGDYCTVDSTPKVPMSEGFLLLL